MNENIKGNNQEFKSNKQIEEMAKATMKHCKIDNQCGSCHWSTCNECMAEVLYNAGYRKETETIAEFKELVKEYLLDRGLYLTAIKNALKYAENKMRKEDEGK